MDLDSTSLGAPLITDVENTTHASSRRREERDWVTTIKDDLRQVSQMRPGSAYVMYRVRPQLRALKPQHYAATEFSFGLFDRSPRGTRMTRADKCKLLMGNAVLKLMGMTETEWPKLSQMVVPNPKEMQDRYDELGRDPLSLQEVQSLLTLDAVFLAGFLGSRFYGPFAERLGSAIDPMTTEMMINSLVTDIFKVENQIPLSLIHTVILILLEKVGVEEHVDRMQVASEILSAVCLIMLGYIAPDLPGRGGDMLSRAEGIHFVQCNSFLDCLYRVMCQGMKESKPAMWKGKEWNLPPVTELQSAGIEFRGRKGTFHDIEFKAGWLKGTLYLPKLDLNDMSETLFRNLVAYEEFHHYDSKDFTLYLHLLDTLIDSHQDVAVLKSGNYPVIDVYNLGDTRVGAKLFNGGLLQYCDAEPNDRWRLIYRQVYDFYHQERRRTYLEFLETNFGKPWLTASVVAAIILLILTILQTYYTVAQYYQN